jgi:hypothetical protein
MRTTRLMACLVALAILPAAAGAKDESADRYTMTPTEGGVVRLDKQTGAMALCRRRDEAWACESMDDNQSQRALKDEVEKLRAENKFLKDQVQQLEETLGLGENQSNAPSSPRAKLVMPSEADVDKAFDYFERMLDKLHERMKKLEKKHGDKPETAL